MQKECGMSIHLHENTTEKYKLSSQKYYESSNDFANTKNN